MIVQDEEQLIISPLFEYPTMPPQYICEVDDDETIIEPVVFRFEMVPSFMPNKPL